MENKTKYHHCYATANDDKYYYNDLKNLLRLKKVAPGVNSIYLYISISKVRELGSYDKFFVWFVKRCFRHHKIITLQSITFKTNVGRDFSSYNLMLEKVKQDSQRDDFVFFQNRSGFGPLKPNWYLDFIEQFEKFKNTAFVGSTISFLDFPLRSNRTDLPHVQTYAFLSKISILKLLENGFPGQNRRERSQIICDGEIGLSQMLLNDGFGISCMEWPESFINLNSEPIMKLDPRGKVEKEHQFLHKVCFKETKGWMKRIDYLKTVIQFFCV